METKDAISLNGYLVKNAGKFLQLGSMTLWIGHYVDGASFILFSLIENRKNVRPHVGMLWAMNANVLVWVRIMVPKAREDGSLFLTLLRQNGKQMWLADC